MSKYIMRLDDASEKRDMEKWNRIEELLDLYEIKPLVGVIPKCEDSDMDIYRTDERFWERVAEWNNKGWEIAMHGFTHVYCTVESGINPVNEKSEFAGLSLWEQCDKIKKGLFIFQEHGINPKVFFAPAHTFDEKTIEALKKMTNIRIISDTIAIDTYCYNDITYVPQQTGKVRSLPFATVTFCYHPNLMDDNSFLKLESFIKRNRKKFIPFPTQISYRKFNILDHCIRKLYFARRL